MEMRYVPNPLAGEEIARGPLARQYYRRRAQAGQEAAQAIAPVDTGRYRDSISSEDTEEGAAFSAGTDYWIYLEYGTEDTPTFAPLRRALGALGGGA